MSYSSSSNNNNNNNIDINSSHKYSSSSNHRSIITMETVRADTRPWTGFSDATKTFSMMAREPCPILPNKALLLAQELAYDRLLSLNDFDDSVATAVWLAFLSFFSRFRLLALSTYTPVALGLLFEGRDYRRVLRTGRGGWDEMGAGTVKSEGVCLSV